MYIAQYMNHHSRVARRVAAERLANRKVEEWIKKSNVRDARYSKTITKAHGILRICRLRNL
eukprot:10791417-Alexandrium_andersonii.AAC.1